MPNLTPEKNSENSSEIISQNLSSTGNKPFLLFGKPLLGLILGLYILDQLTKWLVSLNFTPYGKDKISLIDGFLNIVRVHNTGAAFGLGNGSTWSTYVFLALPVAALCAIIYCFKKNLFFTTRVTKLCGALILAGVLGNLTDRLLQGFFLPGAENLSFFQNLANGYVVDFIDVQLPFTIPLLNTTHWPCFNIADSCITVAAVILFIYSFVTPIEPKKKKKK